MKKLALLVMVASAYLAIGCANVIGLDEYRKGTTMHNGDDAGTDTSSSSDSVLCRANLLPCGTPFPVLCCELTSQCEWLSGSFACITMDAGAEASTSDAGHCFCPINGVGGPGGGEGVCGLTVICGSDHQYWKCEGKSNTDPFGWTPVGGSCDTDGG